MNTKTRFMIVVLALGAVGVGVGLGWLLKDRFASPQVRMTPSAAKAERQILYYRNPMDASIHADKPMQDNMGMDYIPVYAEAAGAAAEGAVKIDPQMLQNLGVRTARVKRQALARSIESVGTVQLNEDRKSVV